MKTLTTSTSVSTWLTRINTKADEVQSYIDAFKEGKSITGEALSINTCKTQIQAKRTQLKTLLVIKALMEHLENSDDASLEGNMPTELLDFLESYTALVDEHKSATIVVNKGDKILDLVQKYGMVKDVMVKIAKAAEKIGCTVNYQTGTID